MNTTPPKSASSPSEEAWKRWAEGRIRELGSDGAVRDTRVQSISEATTSASGTATAAAAGLRVTDARILGADSNNRVARPTTDEAYWKDVIAARKFVFERKDANGSVLERSASRNVSWNPIGSLIFQPSTIGMGERAEINITPILQTPSSKKIYVESEYVAGLNPEIWIEWRGSDGSLLEAAPPTLAASKTTVSTAAAEALGATYYSVKLIRPSTAGVAISREPKVFEVVGTDGLAIGPGGISVDGSGGTKTIEINPSLPVLNAPTAPSLSTGVGNVSVRWTGNLASGAAPAHLSYVYAEESANGTSGWTRVGQPLNRAGDILTRPPVGSQRWYRFIAVDTSNRPSAASASASITVAGVTIPDLGGDIGDVIDTVDGLNKIFYQPASVTPTPHANGDLWFVVDGTTSIVTEVRIWNGTNWNPYRIVADSVVVPGSVGTVTIGDGVITSPKIKVRELEGDRFKVGTISVNELTPNIGSTLDITINPSINSLEEDVETQRRYYRFDEQGLKIGDPATSQELRLTPGRIEMVQAGNVPTYWEAQTFYVERMIVQAANIGSHRFEGYADGRTVIRPLRSV